MMLCRLCVKQCEDGKNLFDENGQCTEFYHIVATYFEAKNLLSEDKKNIIVICMLCWGKIFDFYNFQKFVLESQNKLNDINAKCGDVEHDPCEFYNGIGKITEAEESEQESGSVIIQNSVANNETVEIYSSEEAWITECSDGSSNIGIDMPDSGNEEVSVDSTFQIDSGKYKIKTSNEISEDAPRSTENERYSPTDVDGIGDDTIILQKKSALECRICAKKFLLFQSLRNHFREDHPQFKFYVKCCNSLFYYRCKLAEHIRCHINPYPYKCKVCNRRFTRKSNLISHSHKHHKKTAQLMETSVLCRNCHGIYPSFKALRKHFRQAHPKETIDVQCCGQKFKYHSSYKEHVQRHLDSPPHECKICNKDFSEIDYLITHIENTHQRTQKGNNKRLDDLLSQWNKELECAFCCQPFASIILLRNHIRIKHPKKRFYVACCGLKLKLRWEIENHIRLHLNESVTFFNCKICNVRYSSQVALERHLFKTHKNVLDSEHENSNDAKSEHNE